MLVRHGRASRAGHQGSGKLNPDALPCQVSHKLPLSLQRSDPQWRNALRSAQHPELPVSHFFAGLPQ